MQLIKEIAEFVRRHDAERYLELNATGFDFMWEGSSIAAKVAGGDQAHVDQGFQHRIVCGHDARRLERIR
jgi:hypothetical protein